MILFDLGMFGLSYATLYTVFRNDIAQNYASPQVTKSFFKIDTTNISRILMLKNKMLQPFEIFKPDYLEKLIGLRKKWLVTQTYNRSLNHFAEEKKIALLVSDYDDTGLAKVHLNAVKHDRYAAIIDLDNPTHKLKLTELLSPDSKYQVFWAAVKSRKELEDRINLAYKDHMRKYITFYTSWKIDKNSIIKPSIEVTFGELFIILEYGSQTLRIKFEDIEKF